MPEKKKKRRRGISAGTWLALILTGAVLASCFVFFSRIAGEYMDAEENEYEDEIADFKTRSRNVEFKIKPCISRLYIVTYCDKQVAVSDDFFKVDFGFENKIMSDFKIVTKCDTAYV